MIKERGNRLAIVVARPGNVCFGAQVCPGLKISVWVCLRASDEDFEGANRGRNRIERIESWSSEGP